MESNNAYSLESDNIYTVDKWYKLISEWTCKDINGCSYNSSTTYKLVRFNISDCIYILKNKSFPSILESNITKTLDNNKYFFRVSQRSPARARSGDTCVSRGQASLLELCSNRHTKRCIC